MERLISDALKLIRDSIQDFGVDNIALAFNGGKDCTILLHLVAIVVQELRLISTGSEVGVVYEDVDVCNQNKRCGTGLGGLSVFMFQTNEQFPEVERFVSETAARYGLCVRVIHCSTLKDGVAAVERCGIKAMFSGSRQSDYVRAMHHTMRSDGDWPAVIRVHPILHWTVGDVWRAIKHFNLFFCDLYVHGYTSIGSRSSTKPNSALLNIGDGSYEPAWTLADDEQERAGMDCVILL